MERLRRPQVLRSTVIGLLALALAYLAGFALVIFRNPVAMALVFLVAAGGTMIGTGTFRSRD